jgi:hypothetical protein
VPHRIVRRSLACLCAAIAIVQGMEARADPIAAVAISGKGVLTICRDWILFRTCKPYDKIDLPPQVAVGDRVPISSFGSNPKDYDFRVVEIRRNGEGCVLLSHASRGREDGERIDVPHCDPVDKQAAEPR